MKHVLLVGAATPLGQRVAAHLIAEPDAESVVTVVAPDEEADVEGVESVEIDRDLRELGPLLVDRQIDTVIQVGLAPDRTGETSRPATADVIQAMKLSAAVGADESPVRSLVAASSSAAYPIGSHAPLLHQESREVSAEEDSAAALLLEAEDYLRNLAERRPHLNVAILRLAPLAGIPGELAWMLERRFLPTVIGFDPAVQLLHVEDAAAGLTFAATRELAGLYNLASREIVYWSEAARQLRRTQIPFLPIEAGPLAPVAHALGLPHLPEGMLDLLRFGHTIDTAKLAAAGFEAAHEQVQCLTAIG